MLTLLEIESYLRLDDVDVETETYLNELIQDAEIYLEDCIGSVKWEADKVKPKFSIKAKSLMRVIIADSYESRSMIKDKKEEYSLLFASKILQMRYKTYL
ncbi:head-tail connector protein [Clostridium gasigenes]|uniref:head-tail connector protein n=1 Tax=Clostridium gasigenes TaxID=94869 RepID=UPI001C0D47B2|nr:head-tail connector protein [Clostridium gasigenes]